MGSKQPSAYTIAIGVFCAAICAHGGYVTTGTHGGPVHAMMRRAQKEVGRQQISESLDSHTSAGGKAIPYEVAKQLKARDREGYKTLQKKQQQPAHAAVGQEKQFFEGMFNDTASVPIISVQKMEGSHYRMKGVPGRVVLNIIAKKSDTRARLDLLLMWLQRHLEKLQNHLVIVSDGYSLLNGGCDDHELNERYQRMIRDADGPNRGDGPRVVMGAEFGAADLNKDFTYALAGWRTQILKADKKASEGLYEDLASCKGDSCKTPQRYLYPDAGFIMGPVKDVLRVLTGIQFAFMTKFGADMSEKSAVMDYMIQNPREIALDYTSKLVFSLHNFKQAKDVLLIRGGVLANSILDDTQCFVHGAGDKYEIAMELAEMLRGESQS